MSKQIKYTVAIVLKNQDNPDEFLAVRRPDDDPDLAGHWGLPAATLQPGELPEQGAARICAERLGCSAKSVRFLGIMHQERNAYDIFLMDIEMVADDKQAVYVGKATTTTNTVYTAQKWTTDPMDLMASAKAGSCCSSIFLTDRGLLNKDDWIASLKGSNTVG